MRTKENEKKKGKKGVGRSRRKRRRKKKLIHVRSFRRSRTQISSSSSSGSNEWEKREREEEKKKKKKKKKVALLAQHVCCLAVFEWRRRMERCCVSANVRRLLPFLSISKRQERECVCVFFDLSFCNRTNVNERERDRVRKRKEKKCFFSNEKKMSNQVKMNARKNKWYQSIEWFFFFWQVNCSPHFIQRLVHADACAS